VMPISLSLYENNLVKSSLQDFFFGHNLCLFMSYYDLANSIAMEQKKTAL